VRKDCASNLQFAKSHQNPQTEPRSAVILPEKSQPTRSPRPSPRSPRATRGEWIWRWRPRKQTKKARRRRRSQRLGSGHTISVPSMILINLSPRGCCKTKILSIGAPHSVNLSPWKMLTKSSHFTILPNGVWPSPLVLFFRGLLYYYGLELHHLNPNSICHISIFIHFCETFLGIELHWDLFRFLFRVKTQPTSKNPSVAGGAGIQL
jgi:hypothetical protein